MKTKGNWFICITLMSAFLSISHKNDALLNWFISNFKKETRNVRDIASANVAVNIVRFVCFAIFFLLFVLCIWAVCVFLFIYSLHRFNVNNCTFIHSDILSTEIPILSYDIVCVRHIVCLNSFPLSISI